MKPFYATVLAALLLTVTPVLAEESDEAELPAVRGIGQGQYERHHDAARRLLHRSERGGAVIDFGKMAGDTAHLLVYCGDHPDDDIITAAEEVLDK